MGETGEPTWSVSDASRLAGLSRRDAQRCFFDGKGGGHLPPHAPRSWGKGEYDVHDLAVMFLVAQARRRGLTFAKAARETGARLREASLAELVAEEAEAARDEAAELVERLVLAEALAAALGDEAGLAARLQAVRAQAEALEAPLSDQAWDGPAPTPAQELLDQLLAAAGQAREDEV